MSIVRDTNENSQQQVITYAGNMKNINKEYTNSQTFNLGMVPTKEPYIIFVWNGSVTNRIPVTKCTWNPGTPFITILDPLIAGDQLFILVEMAGVPITGGASALIGNSGATYSLKVDDSDPTNLRTYPVLNT
jgi:hypothetical protein